MNSESAESLLAHALPPAARHDRFRRSFDAHHRKELVRFGVTPAQTERLERILPAIAYYTTQGPRLADVNVLLERLAKDAHKASTALRTLLDAPEHEQAHDESRLRLFEALLELHPERCEIDPQRVSFFHRYDPREDEARRLLSALADVESAASRACERSSTAEQTRAKSHDYPVGLIDAALSVDGPQVPPSESVGSAFFEIAGICYAAARGASTEPLRAIRAYLSTLNSRPEN
ncbi:hypothetical protein CS053_15255 [Rhodanobacter glycinis]|uniref:Uncharacterized protein n=1 Tax=Rhodanobacter glycinis TaxID=582702 RepID=A0A5B9E1Y3_9GAMM|nr:hypothetical protein [Rhodanobacter glycinis]QEE25709.1 hypothetical protein CS053_15255 [Rhodanobacter glycinis]